MVREQQRQRTVTIRVLRFGHQQYASRRLPTSTDVCARLLLIALIIALLISCGTSTADLAAMVQEACVSQWEEAYIPITITKDLILTKKSKTEYTGFMTISLFGETEQVTMNVIYDGETFTWQIEGW
jgi:hypothetical protein